jgi:UDP-GlcNAc:undecaprenyl-phosphate GlcNAc-1-phosphate transferase
MGATGLTSAGADAATTTFLQVANSYWPVLLVSFLVSLVLTPLCRRVALKRGIVDKPDAWLKPHEKPIAYLGGVAIFFGWLSGLVLAFVLLEPGRMGEVTTGASVDRALMLGILIAGTAIMLLGLCDDLRVMTPKVKLAGNVLVALLLLGFGLGDEIITVLTNRVNVSFDGNEQWLVWLYSVPISVFLIVGACNATNLIDGLDGLCSGVIGINAIGFLILAIHLHVYHPWNPGDGARVVLSLALLGGALGFLPFNRNPAKIFMGDAGSMLLGLNSAILLLLFAEERRLRWMMASVVVFGLPVADMVLTLVRRWRAQRPVMQGDRSHFYDQLIDRGLGVKRVVYISYALSAGFVLLGILPTFMRMRHFLLVYVAAAGLLAYLVHRHRMVRVDSPQPTATSTEE